MKYKNIIVLSTLATVLFSSLFITVVAAQEGSVDPSRVPEPSAFPDAGLLGSAPDDNVTTTDGEQLYRILDDNATVPADEAVPGAEDANLFTANTASTPDNTLAIIVIAVLAVVIVGCTVGVIYFRKNAVKPEI